MTGYEGVADVLVVGGGCAGLACATTLVEEGYQVTVLDAQPSLGGRTSSFRDSQSGEVLDNGQHLFLGCYSQTQDYLARIGSAHGLQMYDRFEVEMRGVNGHGVFSTVALPTPLHLIGGLMRFAALPWMDRLRLARLIPGLFVGQRHLSKISAHRWLQAHGQSKLLRERFWDPLIWATLNADADKIPASLLAVVLKRGFLASRKSAAMGIASVSLDELLVRPAVRFIQNGFGQVRARARVAALNFSKHGIDAVCLDSGECLRAKTVVMAMPPKALLRLLSSAPKHLQDDLADIGRLVSSPIVSAHLCLSHRNFAKPVVGFWGATFHWLFDRPAFWRNSETRYVSLVASAADKLVPLSASDILKLAETDLAMLYPHENYRILRGLVRKDLHATWYPPVGSTAKRPGVATAVANLFLAGDWTDTGLPATIESAIVSGHRAAQKVRKYLGPVN